MIIMMPLRKPNQVVMIAILGCLRLMSPLSSAQESPGYINVRDYIVKAGNPADHTEAIRAAFAEAGRTQVYTVLFPAGYYTISDAIDIRQGTPFSPQGASIKQTNPEKDIFVNKGAWRLVIRNFSFHGGRDQIVLGTNHCDQSVLEVSDCTFFDANGVAIRILKDSNSTLFKVKDCAFTNCLQSVINYCDICVIGNCWISSSPKMQNKAVMENYGVMHVENLLGVPSVSRGKAGFTDEWIDPRGGKQTASNQRWIDNYGTVTCRSCRFGGEDGGFPAVVNYARDVSVILDSCYVYNCSDAAIVCREIPTRLTVVHCTGFEDAWVLRVDPRIDLDTYFDKQRMYLDIGDGQGVFGTGIPEQMMPYLVGEIRAEAPPAKGRWTRGQFIRNLNLEGRETATGYVKAKIPALDQPYGWYCIESGKPGTWVPVKFTVVEGQPSTPAAK